MGVHDLPQLIKSETGTHAMKQKNISSFKGMKVAVDTSLLVHKMGIGSRGSGVDMVNKDGQLTSHLCLTFYKILQFLENGMTPIFVFDGKPPDLKNTTLGSRAAIKSNALAKMNEIEDTTSGEYIKYFKQTFKPTINDYNELKIMLDLMGIPYISAPGEADTVLSWLASREDESGEKFVDGVCSEDSDMLPHGSPYLFKNMLDALGKNGFVTVIDLDKTLKHMDITMNQFIDICLLLGCDFCNRIKNVGPKKIYNLIKTRKNLRNVIKFLKEESLTNKKIIVDKDNVKCMFSAREYFRNSVSELDDILKIKKKDISLKLFHCDELIDFMCNKHDFSRTRIESGIKKLSIYYAKMGIIEKNTQIIYKMTQASPLDDFIFMSDSEDSNSNEIISGEYEFVSESDSDN